MDKPETLSFSRRHLPHWEVKDRSYFVTFRLFDSLPRSVLGKIARVRAELEELPQEIREKRRQLHRLGFRIIENMLDKTNPRIAHLKNDKIAEILVQSFDFVESNFGWRSATL